MKFIHMQKSVQFLQCCLSFLSRRDKESIVSSLVYNKKDFPQRTNQKKYLLAARQNREKLNSQNLACLYILTSQAWVPAWTAV